MRRIEVVDVHRNHLVPYRKTLLVESLTRKQDCPTTTCDVLAGVYFELMTTADDGGSVEQDTAEDVEDLGGEVGEVARLVRGDR